jgi:hypothetical protein
VFESQVQHSYDTLCVHVFISCLCLVPEATVDLHHLWLCFMLFLGICQSKLGHRTYGFEAQHEFDGGRMFLTCTGGSSTGLDAVAFRRSVLWPRHEV